ncbi:MAG TPA: histidinol dehydrogenase [Candidatus Saccharicenans sp.]|nr:histidinol dehydrogenase [Candidatus Saccharicenans sp.]
MLKICRAEELEKTFFDYAEPECLEDVRKIIKEVRQKGDEALKKFTILYDDVSLDDFRVSQQEIKRAEKKVDSSLKKAMAQAAENLKVMSRSQLNSLKNLKRKIKPGVIAEQKIIPINRVGIYVPGGRYPLFSSLLMAAIPARLAGVKEVIVCSPPSFEGSLHPVLLYAARLSRVDEIYKLGGAQAVAAMALGTESIKKVDKIVGPGNLYVTAAKKELFGQAGIDFIAGPTELLIIADEKANPAFIAADLIAQAEHDLRARPVLITTEIALAKKVNKEIEEQVKRVSTRETAKRSLAKNGIIIIVKKLEEAIALANRMAPEHLAVFLEKPEQIIDKLLNYGSLFVGEYTSEVLGDYSSGLNHILPTNSASRYTGGLSVRDFLKFQTVLRVSKKGLSEIGPATRQLAEAEGLEGHANSIKIRLKGKSG